MKTFLFTIITAAFVVSCSSERVPDTQQREQDSAQKMMDTMPDMRLDTVAVK